MEHSKRKRTKESLSGSVSCLRLVLRPRNVILSGPGKEYQKPTWTRGPLSPEPCHLNWQYILCKSPQWEGRETPQVSRLNMPSSMQDTIFPIRVCSSANSPSEESSSHPDQRPILACTADILLKFWVSLIPKDSFGARPYRSAHADPKHLWRFHINQESGSERDGYL